LIVNVKDVLFQGGGQLWQILVTADSLESFFCSQQSGDAPAMSHVAVAVTLDSVSYLASPAEHRLDRVRCQKEALQRLAIREGFTVVSLRAQEKTPRSRILLPWGLSGMKPTLFEKETETFRKRRG
jgi:hypothetical protein